MEKQTIIEMRGITKRFGGRITANNNVTMDVKRGEILSVLGEDAPESIDAALKKVISAKRADMMEVNLRALKLGAEA